jgi:hypothetical protein
VARKFIHLHLVTETCCFPPNPSPLVRGETVREYLEISGPYQKNLLDPEATGWSTVSRHVYRDMDGLGKYYGLSPIADGMAIALGSRPHRFGLSVVPTGAGSGKGCQCGQMHLRTDKHWQIPATKRAQLLMLAFDGQADTSDEYEAARQQYQLFRDEFDKFVAAHKEVVRG